MAKLKHFLKLRAISRLRRLTLFSKYSQDAPAVFNAELFASTELCFEASTLELARGADSDVNDRRYVVNT